VTWLIYTCDMTHLYVWHDSFICVTWLIYTFDMTHWGTSTRRLIRRRYCNTASVHTCDMTHSHSHLWHEETCHTCEWDMYCNSVGKWRFGTCIAVHVLRSEMSRDCRCECIAIHVSFTHVSLWTSFVWARLVLQYMCSHLNASCHMYKWEWVMSHV